MAPARDAAAEQLALPGRPESVRRARRFVAEVCARRAFDPDLVEGAVLLVSEVLTNSVVHVGADVVVTVSCPSERAVVVGVSDPGPLHPVVRDVDLDAVTGRGLAMVEMLASGFGSVPTAAGKLVWFSVGDTGAAELPGSQGWAEPAPVEHRLWLTGLPVGLWDVMRQHNDALLREYQLMLLREQWEGDSLIDPRRAQLAAVARTRSSVAGQIQRAIPAQDVGDPSARVDVVVRLTPQDVRAAAALPMVLDAAEAHAARGAFLVRAALPELVSLRNWLFGEIGAQADGAPPSAWVDPDALMRVGEARPVEVDLSWVQAQPRALVVADDANRVVALSPALTALLGWSEGDLLGRRVSLLVPETLREAHVTAFSRYVQTGVAHIIGTQVELPARHRDGRQVPVVLRLEQQGEGASMLLLGWLAAAAQPAPGTLPG